MKVQKEFESQRQILREYFFSEVREQIEQQERKILLTMQGMNTKQSKVCKPQTPQKSKSAFQRGTSVIQLPSPNIPKSNKSLTKNALMNTCLAGSVSENIKNQVLYELEESPAHHFVILLREANNFSFKGLYFWDKQLDQTVKLYSGSAGPTVLDPLSVTAFYKYDCGARTFKAVTTRSFGISVHAVAISRTTKI